MKKHFVVYIICIFSVCFIGGWMFSKYAISPRVVEPSDWQGKWIMDDETEKGHVHSILELADVSRQGFRYLLAYTYGDVSGGDNSDYFSGKVQVLKNEITQTWYFNDGSKNVVRTLTLSKDKKSISLYEDTCPGFLNVSLTPDGCEIPIHNGTYYRLK